MVEAHATREGGPSRASGNLRRYDPPRMPPYLSPAPLYHAAPLGCLTSTGSARRWWCWRSSTLSGHSPRSRPTGSRTASTVPTMFIRMLRLPAAIRAKWDLSSLRYAVHAAAPCPIPVKERMIDWWGPVPRILWYGGGLFHDVLRGLADAQGDRGPVPGRRAARLRPGGEELPPGTIGTLYFSGGPTFEYHGDAAKTAAPRPQGTRLGRPSVMSGTSTRTVSSTSPTGSPT